MTGGPGISNYGKARIVKLALNKGQRKHIPGMVERGASVKQLALHFNISQEKAADYVRVLCTPTSEEVEASDEAREHEAEAEAPRVQPVKARKTRGKAKARKGG